MPAQFSSIERRSASFWSRVAVGDSDACWPWLGYCVPAAPSRLPYGRWSYRKGGVVRAHRAAWMFDKHQDIPQGMLVCHRCDNPKCCNPQHLFLGTDGDNNRDRAAKGRTVRPERDEAAVAYATGAAHGSARLTAEQAAAIRTDPRSLSILASEYGVNFSTIGRIKRGETWKALAAEAAGPRSGSTGVWPNQSPTPLSKTEVQS